jgi:2-polyprenyl-3-methyl-5-hydroxy-6-metoxy-1,4-benzoquinol methylase
MPSTPDYIAVNKQSWNSRTPLHLASAFYDVPGFLAGKTSLQPIELALLGDVAGKRILHLQCHFGQDTISLARMGAHVTGVDLSDEAIRAAERLADQAGVAATFICCDVYDLPAHLDATFDVVFTSYGVIGWLPDMDRWARLIATYLVPGGKLVFAEFHPVLWMFDNDFEGVAYRYFKSEPIVETETGTYADPTAPLELTMVTWNHSLSEVLGALLRSGLALEAFEEFDYSPYDCFRHTREDEPGRYRIAHLEDRIPMVYALVAGKG